MVLCAGCTRERLWRKKKYYLSSILSQQNELNNGTYVMYNTARNYLSDTKPHNCLLFFSLHRLIISAVMAEKIFQTILFGLEWRAQYNVHKGPDYVHVDFYWKNKIYFQRKGLSNSSSFAPRERLLYLKISRVRTALILKDSDPTSFPLCISPVNTAVAINFTFPSQSHAIPGLLHSFTYLCLYSVLSYTILHPLYNSRDITLFRLSLFHTVQLC